MDALLKALLGETVQHAPYVAQDAYGAPTFGATVDRKARIQYSVQRFLTAQGEERNSRAILYLDGDATIDLRDRLTLPDGTEPGIQRVDNVMDENGVRDHIKVFV
jgi:hypothetical protein